MIEWDKIPKKERTISKFREFLESKNKGQWGQDKDGNLLKPAEIKKPHMEKGRLVMRKLKNWNYKNKDIQICVDNYYSCGIKKLNETYFPDKTYSQVNDLIKYCSSKGLIIRLKNIHTPKQNNDILETENI